MPPRIRKTLTGLGWAAIAIGVWSGSLVMLRLGVTTHLNAYDLTMLRFGVASVILLPVALRRGLGTDRLGFGGVLALIGLFGAPYVLLLSLAMTTAPAAAAGALNPGVMAVSSVLLGRLVLGDRIGGIRMAGLALAMSGIVWLTSSGGGVTPGHLILTGTGIMWALYALVVRSAGVPALNAAAIVAVGSAMLYLPLYTFALPHALSSAPMTDILMQAGFQGVLVSVVAIYAFNRSAELLGPVAGATLPALIPAVTLALGAVLLGETVSIEEAAAAILVTLGLALILVGRQARQWLRDRTQAPSRRSLMRSSRDAG
ncbi:DMT family transporter [Martelella mangrovi]|uniref:Drug/metabolite transporter (DMT)-like permease n=1 Tax=Martelella mangrovi TaxID=1397477 RepID=A0ABV2IAJ1_9HYPH